VSGPGGWAHLDRELSPARDPRPLDDDRVGVSQHSPRLLVRLRGSLDERVRRSAAQDAEQRHDRAHAPRGLDRDEAPTANPLAHQEGSQLRRTAVELRVGDRRVGTHHRDPVGRVGGVQARPVGDGGHRARV